MKKFSVLSLLAGAAVLLSTALSVSAEESAADETYTSGDFSYTLDEDGNATLTAYTGGADLVIPEELDGHPVTLATPYLFADNDTLKTVSVSAAMLDLGDSCFFGCDNIQSFTVAEESTIYEAVDGVLYSKDGTFLVAYPLAREETTFAVPDGIEQIGTGAFGYSRLDTVSLPESITTINEWAFAYSEITQIDLPSDLNAIYDYAFAYCTNMTDWTLPDKLEYIGNATFANCTGMMEITLPDSLTTIGMSAFTGTGLTSITIPASVTSIGYCAVGYQDMTTPVDDFIIYGLSGSKAQEYATETDEEYDDYQNNFTFVPVKDASNKIQEGEDAATSDKKTDSNSQTIVEKEDRNIGKLIFGSIFGIVLLGGGVAILLGTRSKRPEKKAAQQPDAKTDSEMKKKQQAQKNHIKDSSGKDQT